MWISYIFIMLLYSRVHHAGTKKCLYKKYSFIHFKINVSVYSLQEECILMPDELSTHTSDMILENSVLCLKS